MTIHFKAGGFEIIASDPHPMWVTIYFEGKNIGGIDHRHLPDLLHVLNRAMSAMRAKLGPDAHELD